MGCSGASTCQGQYCFVLGGTSGQAPILWTLGQDNVATWTKAYASNSPYSRKLGPLSLGLCYTKNDGRRCSQRLPSMAYPCQST